MQGDYGRDIERPRNNSSTVRFFYPDGGLEPPDARTGSAARSPASRGWACTAFVGTYSIVTDQDRPATATSTRRIERADVAAKDFHVRGFAEKLVGRVRLDAGVDVNGRFDLEAHDIGVFYDAAGQIDRTTDNVSIEDARRTDAGLYLQAEAPGGERCSLLAAGGRFDYVDHEEHGRLLRRPRREQRGLLRVRRR